MSQWVRAHVRMCASRFTCVFFAGSPPRSAELLWIPFQNDLHRNNGAHAAAKNHHPRGPRCSKKTAGADVTTSPGEASIQPSCQHSRGGTRHGNAIGIRMNLILGYSGLRIAETLVLYESPKLEAGAWLLAFVKCRERFHAGVGLLPCPEENVENQGRNATIEMANQEGNIRQPKSKVSKIHLPSSSVCVGIAWNIFDTLSLHFTLSTLSSFRFRRVSSHSCKGRQITTLQIHSWQPSNPKQSFINL